MPPNPHEISGLAACIRLKKSYVIMNARHAGGVHASEGIILAQNYEHDQDSCGCGCGCGETPAAVDPELGAFWKDAPATEIVCYCGQVSKGSLVEAIQRGAYTLPVIKIMTGACKGKDCETLNPRSRCCAKDIQQLIALYGQRPSFSFA